MLQQNVYEQGQQCGTGEDSMGNGMLFLCRSQSPTPMLGAHNNSNFSSRESNVLFTLPSALHSNAGNHMHAHTHNYEIKISVAWCHTNLIQELRKKRQTNFCEIDDIGSVYVVSS